MRKANDKLKQQQKQMGVEDALAPDVQHRHVVPLALCSIAYMAYIWHIGSLDCPDCRKVEKLTDDIADMQAEMKEFETF